MVQLRKSLEKKASKNKTTLPLSYAPLPLKEVFTRLDASGDVNIFSNLEPSVVFKITGVAATIWPLFDGQTNVGDILQKLKTEFPGTEPAQARQMLANFISDLQAASLVK